MPDGVFLLLGVLGGLAGWTLRRRLPHPAGRAILARRACPVCRLPDAAPPNHFCAPCEAQYGAALAADQGGRWLAATAKARALDLRGAAVQRYVGLALFYSRAADGARQIGERT